MQDSGLWDRTTRGRWARLLEASWWPGVVVVAGVLLASPSLGAGWDTEDWGLRFRALSGELDFPRQVNLFGVHLETGRTLLPDQGDLQLLVAKAKGLMPWIAAEDLAVSFWRPLASLTHHLDFRLFPATPWVAHLHSLAWSGLMVAAAGVLFARLIRPRWAAGLATLLYGIEDAHGRATGWLSNRNAIMAAAFAFLFLWSYDRFRRDGWKPGAWLSPALMGLALTSGEMAVGIVGYWVAYLVLIDRAVWWKRLAAAVPTTLVLAAWAGTYLALGHGTAGSGMYIGPVSEPWRFLAAMPRRASALLAAQISGAPLDLLQEAPTLEASGTLWVEILAVAFGAVVLVRVLRAAPAARFWALGSLLSLVPCCAAAPEDRLLLLAGAGFFALVAEAAASLASRGTRSRFYDVTTRMFLGFVCLAHGAAAVVLHPIRSLTLARLDARLTRHGQEIMDVVGDSRRGVVVVNAHSYNEMSLALWMRLAKDLAIPQTSICLVGSLAPLEIFREGASAVVVRPSTGFVAAPLNALYRGSSRPLHPGDAFPMLGVTARIEAVDDAGMPEVASFHFAAPADVPRWVVLRRGHYVSFEVPPVGQSIVVEGDR